MQFENIREAHACSSLGLLKQICMQVVNVSANLIWFSLNVKKIRKKTKHDKYEDTFVFVDGVKCRLPRLLASAICTQAG